MRALAELLGEIGQLKRIRTPGTGGRSLAAVGFVRSWGGTGDGRPPERRWAGEAAHGIVGSRLGGIDLETLQDAGLAREEALEVLRRAFDEAAGESHDELRRAVGAATHDAVGPPPAFVARLAAQPRAGPTAPGRSRTIVEPAETHAEHCWVVAVGAVLLSEHFGADPEPPFLCGLAHHLHNAWLPDSGFAGEELLGAALEPVVATLRERALAELDPRHADRVRRALELLPHADTPEARAFHAADVLDRVLQMRHHARAAAFTLEEALDEMELVHAGPLQEFGLRVVEEAGIA